MEKTILITGGTGFAGSHLVDLLLEKNETNVHVTAYGTNTSHVHELLPDENIHQLNLTDQQATADLIKQLKPDQIYHLASIAAVGSSIDAIRKTVQINFEIQLNLLDAVVQHAPQARILTISSALVYQPKKEKLSETDLIGPLNPYGVSKALQDNLSYFYHLKHDLDIIRVRAFNHIGERQALGFVVPDFAMQIAKIESEQQNEIRVGNLEAIRDFTDVKDMVSAYFLLMEKGETGEVYNAGSGTGITIKDLLYSLIDLSTADIKVVQDPDKYRPLDVEQIICDNTKIKDLGWEIKHDLDLTFSRVLDYYRELTKNSK